MRSQYILIAYHSCTSNRDITRGIFNIYNSKMSSDDYLVVLTSYPRHSGMQLTKKTHYEITFNIIIDLKRLD